MFFGGLRANEDVSFAVARGELVGLIGPNGAGKSTLFNCLAGVYEPTAGRIFLKGRDVTGLKPYDMARLGLARTFQVLVTGGDLTVLENVMVGCFALTRSRRRARERAETLLDKMGLLHLARELMVNLPVAAQKRVAMAAALGTEPELLLLDEVAAGLNPAEIEEMIAAIRWVHERLAVTVILIEHVMELVMNLAQRVMVLDSGRLIRQGSPQEVVADPAVIKAYLGERYVREHGAELA
jgi:branched-chain amino acid transport system ATP-binding protein